MNSSEAEELLTRLKNTLRELEQWGPGSDAVEDLRQSLGNMIVYVENQQKRSG